ncbi:hypothetical protein IWZ03DRAFT_359430 [Phyllosticta citriasiana]|uniref:Zn(2)-C6 fungal-type domain-containing protein n=1 Tax=Phyllosticta citriasiana TaxID=595635 RepID=A0ABR1KPK4_9PEZI
MKRLREADLNEAPDLSGLRGFDPADAWRDLPSTNPRPLKIRRRLKQQAPKVDQQLVQQPEHCAPQDDEPKSKRQVLEYRRPLDNGAFYAISEARWERLKAIGDKAAMRKYTHIGRIMEGEGQQTPTPCSNCVKAREECWVYKEDVRREQGLGSNQCARCRYKQHSCSLAKAVDAQQVEVEAGGWVLQKEYQVLERKCEQLQREMDELRAQTASRLASLEERLG